ncbi:MAG: membrane protein insertion efficiency factor YidD [Proteobacteria bacterium]|nr:membrane protein insertion efficiency factor YidD [Pseudomonadota bacterium]
MNAAPPDAAPLSVPARALVFLVKGYRLLLSPWLGSACRFEPTCSVYSIEALQTHGAAHGSYLTLRRLSRCHPWCDGGHDPVPAKTGDGAPASGALFSFLSSDKKSSP